MSKGGRVLVGLLLAAGVVTLSPRAQALTGETEDKAGEIEDPSPAGQRHEAGPVRSRRSSPDAGGVRGSRPRGGRSRHGPPSSGGVFLNPLAILFGLYGVEGGVGLSDHMSLNVSGTVIKSTFYPRICLVQCIEIDVGGWHVGIGLQFFPEGHLYQGFFIYPSVQYTNIKVTGGGGEAFAGGPAFLGGYQWDWRPFSFRLAGGFSYGFGSAKGDVVEVISLGGARPALDASLGVTF